jgi:hypothetical protein
MRTIGNKWYYRLKQVDVSGDYDYSVIRVVHSSPFEERLSVYPNPFTQQIFLQNQGEACHTQVQLFDLNGKQLLDIRHLQLLKSDASVVSMPLELAPGVYILKALTDTGYLQTWKITKY